MRPPEDEAQKLLRLARQDMAILSRILDAAEIDLAGVCFHAQQCVEKALKAVVVNHGMTFERTHNLLTLADALLDRGVSTPVAPEQLLQLNPCAVTLRYDDMEIPTITRQEAMTMATCILDWADAMTATGRRAEAS